MPVQIRPARVGDGDGMARVWLTAGAYYAALDPAHFQLPSAEGLAASFDADIAATSEDSEKLRLIAECDDLMAGWLTAHLEHPYTSELTGYPAASRERSTYCMMPPCR
jgi:hypothetical protein